MNISPALTQGFSRALLQIQKHSPVILTSIGVAGLLGAGVLAAKATLKLEETVDKGNLRLEHAKISAEDGELTPRKKTVVLVHNAADIAKLYWVPITVATGSTIFILGAHQILNRRNAALVVAYQGLQTAFNNYRERVVEQYGAEVDNDFRLGLRDEVVVGEDGKKSTVKVLDRASTNEYLFEFGPANPNWVGNAEHNDFFLRGQQNILNDRLRARGHLFLSEVLDNLGVERTPASIVTGWVYDPARVKGGDGDNFVEFNIQNLWDTHGYILLDFNVDGTIFDKI